MTSNKKIALVLDGDYLVFSSMAAAEDETDWGDDIWTLICDHEKARRILENTIAEIVKKRKAWKDAKIVMCFTDDNNWRKDVLPTYKANRKGSRKPVGYKKFVAEVMADPRFNSFLRPTLEGDDCMGIIGTRPQIVGCDHAVLVSCDKDFKTIPNCEFFWLTTGEILSHTTAEADYWHMEQTIKGDTTDGYGGIPGMGEDTTRAFLDEPYYFVQESRELKTGKNKGHIKTEWKKYPKREDMTLWDCMVTLAAKAGMTEEELLVQAQVARICRASDYDPKSKEVILWTPSM